MEGNMKFTKWILILKSLREFRVFPLECASAHSAAPLGEVPNAVRRKGSVPFFAGLRFLKSSPNHPVSLREPPFRGRGIWTAAIQSRSDFCRFIFRRYCAIAHSLGVEVGFRNDDFSKVPVLPRVLQNFFDVSVSVYFCAFSGGDFWLRSHARRHSSRAVWLPAMRPRP